MIIKLLFKVVFVFSEHYFLICYNEYMNQENTFSEKVIKAALSIPSGRVATYGDVARVCGGGGQAARSISGILGRAQKKGVIGIPWHRIVYSGGKVWCNQDHDQERKKLYDQEGIDVNDKGYIQNYISTRYEF